MVSTVDEIHLKDDPNKGLTTGNTHSFQRGIFHCCPDMIITTRMHVSTGSLGGVRKFDIETIYFYKVYLS